MLGMIPKLSAFEWVQESFPREGKNTEKQKNQPE
jgi:hypothetical protein